MKNKPKLLFACMLFSTIAIRHIPAADNNAPVAIDPALQHNLTIVQSEHENNLDPHTASYSSEAQLLCGLYEGLFSYDPETLDPLPALAEDYHISRNKLRWTFILRDGIKFSNGDPITADDVRESWLDLLADPKASYASLLDIIRGAKAFRTGTGKRDDVGITALNKKTVVIQLETPASHLPRILCHHAFAIVNKDPAVSSGAFVISEQTEKQLILKKNENYWDADNVHLPQITILQSDDANQNTFMFNTGTADWVADVLDINELLDHNAVKIHAEYGTQYLFFKCENAPWNNPDFRNALLAAVPWAELRKGALVPATTFVYPLGSYPQVNGLNYTDNDEAADLMKSAREKASIAPDKDIPVTFAIIDNQYMSQEAEILKKAWKPLGVTLSIQKTPANRYLDSISTWKADLFSYTWIGDFSDPLAFLELFRSDSTLNPSGWKNPEFDSFLDQAAASTADEDHLKLLSQAEQLLLDSGEILPISHPVSLHAIDLDLVGGWSSNALDMHPLKYLYFKHKDTNIPNIVMK